MSIFIHLPKIDPEWIAAKENNYYEVAWEEFRYTRKAHWGDAFADGYDALTDYQHEMWEPQYCSQVFTAIPNIVRAQMEEHDLMNEQITSDNVEAFNEASRNAVTSVADVIADTYFQLIGIERD